MTKPDFAVCAAVFDVDGTMVDNAAYHEWAWIELGRRRGLGITADYYRSRIHSRSNETIVKDLLGNDVSAETIRSIGDEKEAIYRERYKPDLKAVPGLTAFLAELARVGIPCAVVSNSPIGNVAMVLDVLEIRGHFRAVLTCEDVPRGKPDPAMLLEAARRMDVPPPRCVVFEDSKSGFEAAERAGMPYIAITAGADPAHIGLAARAVARRQDFSRLSADFVKSVAAGPRKETGRT